MASFKDFSKKSMAAPNRLLSRIPGAPRNYGLDELRSTLSRQKHFEITSLDKQLRDLLDKKVVQLCVTGYKEETLQQQRWRVLCQVANWLKLSDAIHFHQDEWVLDELLTLLSKDLKRKNLKQIPREELEWTRLLNQWLRQHSSEDVINRSIYKLLAVDGFEGFEAKDLKTYLSCVLNSKDVREEYRQHQNAVRSMYDWIDANPEIFSLMGMDSACTVFLALLQLFENKLDVLFSDDQIALQTHQTRRLAEGFLYRNANYYRDVHKITEDLLRKLGEIYEMAWKGKDWTKIAIELMTQFVNNKK